MSSKESLVIDEGRIPYQAPIEPRMKIQESIEVRYLRAGDVGACENALSTSEKHRTVHELGR
jgi:hypothetical protein